ncbi:MAG: tripartite tricarboxylate transporter permease, partial [Deltaproteobacteria bacterium]|nr:tripartite tricarboxylate transporter permease [Deltaproteobacteria bacterium]
IILAPPLALFALRFGPPEYFALMVSGLVVLSYLTYGSVIKGLMMATIGLILGAVGNDTITGVARYTFNVTVLSDGIGFIPVVMGLFGVAEVLTSLEEEARGIFKTSLRGLLPGKKDWQESAGPIARGSVLGFFLGILP